VYDRQFVNGNRILRKFSDGKQNFVPRGLLFVQQLIDDKQEEYPFQTAHQINIAGILCPQFVKIRNTIPGKDLTIARERVEVEHHFPMTFILNNETRHR